MQLSRKVSLVPFRASMQVRYFGITDTLTSFANNKVLSEKEKKFASMLQMMLSKPKWTLRDWKVTLDDQLNSWMMYIPGSKDSAQAKDMKMVKEIIETMAPAYVDDPSLIDSKARESICRTSGKTIEEVHKMMTLYNQSVIVHKWLAMKKAGGEVLPENDAEFLRLQENDVRIRGIAQKVMKKDHRTGRSRQVPY